MICLLAAGVLVPLGAQTITLRWTHSVEKIVWEEDWVDAAAGLTLTASRVRGSGAGMEPAADARWVDGAWTWQPHVGPLRAIVLRRSGATADWSVCRQGNCQPMSAYVGPLADPVTLTSCEPDQRGDRGTSSGRPSD
ncbi:DUF1850 domain-containing protein [Methylobacterium sp. D48H]